MNADGASPFMVSSSGTNATLAPCSLRWGDGTVTPIPQQTVWLWANLTNYLGIDLYTGGFVNYPRPLDMGTRFVARVVCDASHATWIDYLAENSDVPVGGMEAVKKKLMGGRDSIRAVAIGDSISGPYPLHTTNWLQALFVNPSWSPDFMPHTGTWAVSNYAVGTQTPVMGLTALGRFIPSAFGVGGPKAVPFYSSPILDGLTDIAFVGFYNHSANYKLSYVESIVRLLRRQGVAVILHGTEPDLGPSGTNYWDHFSEGPGLFTIAQYHGASFVDTQSRMIFLLTQKGTPAQFLADRRLHPNDAGHLQYAKWFRSVLNLHAQTDVETPGKTQSIWPPTTPMASVSFPVRHDIVPPTTVGGIPRPVPTNNIYHNVGAFNGANPAQYIGNISNNTGGWAASSGGEFQFFDPRSLTLNLLVDGAQAFNCDIVVNGTKIKRIQFGGVRGRPAIVECLNVEEMVGIGSGLSNFGTAGYSNALTFTMVITSGTTTLYGAVFGVPED